MQEQQISIWTGGGAGDPEDRRRAAAIPLLPDPDPLPRAAVIAYWWGKVPFEMAAVACSVRTTPWGARKITWLHCNATQVTGAMPVGSATTMTLLVPAHYVTAVRPGPGFTISTHRPTGSIGLFPPIHPAPPHAICLPLIERSLAGLPDAPGDDRGFTISYPVFALRRPSGDYLGYGPDGDRPGGKSFGIAVFTTEAGAINFMRSADRRSRWHKGRTRLRVEAFDRTAAFRRFLRSVRDSGTCVLFDPVCGLDGHLYADHAFPAAVVLEQFLPQVVWGWSYPVYVMRSVTAANVLATGEGHRGDGTPVTVLPVFTDADLADRALLLASQPMTVAPIPDSETFARVIGELPAGTDVAFDPDPARSATVKTAMSRDDLLAHLEDLEL